MTMDLNRIGETAERRQQAAAAAWEQEQAQAAREYDAIASSPSVQALLPDMLKSMEETLDNMFAASERGTSVMVARSTLFRRMPPAYGQLDERAQYIAEEEALKKLDRENNSPDAMFRLSREYAGSNMFQFKVERKPPSE
jgi:hypothetical protein